MKNLTPILLSIQTDNSAQI